MNDFDTQTGTDLAVAAHWLEAGACVAIPTETVYGLAANALDPGAVVRIFTVKNRPAFDPLIVHVPGIEAVERYATDFPAHLRALAERFWPGPLTLLLPRRAVIPDLVTSGLPRVALRAPAHPVARQLLSRLAFPLAAPSANPFGYISPTTARHVFDQLQGKIPYILDGGPCAIGVESTIVGFEAGQTTVYRLGGLAVEALEAVVGPVSIQLNQSSNPAAPGMLKTHYAPRKTLILGDIRANLARIGGKKAGILSFTPMPGLPPEWPQVALSATGNLAEAAQHLFAALRHLDQLDIDLILAETCPEEGLGRAINDRLRRAAAPDDE
ncbi:MAG: threonylcarbamoyl-AMP synthase [Saprospiraceae bacterium]|nr:threonylcarbamoyl-AMP synthase [Saprospiraceae bacterium]